jgi:hypothetical protein
MPSLFEKGRPGPLITAAGVGKRMGLQPCRDLGIQFIGEFWFVALGGAVLADEFAGSSLANPESAALSLDCASAPVWG